jgi:hypothetical protein
VRIAALAAALMLLCVLPIAASEPADPDPTPVNALLFELNGLSLGGRSWLVGFAVEYQRALGNTIVISLIPELTVGSIRNEIGVLLGLVVHPLGGGLRGLFIGAYPGINYTSQSVYCIAEADVGYQWVMECGIVVHLSIGGRYNGRVGITRSGSFRIGFAF